MWTYSSITQPGLRFGSCPLHKWLSLDQATAPLMKTLCTFSTSMAWGSTYLWHLCQPDEIHQQGKKTSSTSSWLQTQLDLHMTCKLLTYMAYLTMIESPALVKVKRMKLQSAHYMYIKKIDLWYQITFANVAYFLEPSALHRFFRWPINICSHWAHRWCCTHQPSTVQWQAWSKMVLTRGNGEPQKWQLLKWKWKSSGAEAIRCEYMKTC